MEPTAARNFTFSEVVMFPPDWEEWLCLRHIGCRDHYQERHRHDVKNCLAGFPIFRILPNHLLSPVSVVDFPVESFAVQLV